MWNLKSNDTNELTYKTKRLLGNELLVAGGEGIVRELGMDMYTLLYSKWITNGTADGTLINVMCQPGC